MTVASTPGAADTTVRSLSAALRSGATTAQALTEAALARATDPLGEGARVFTRLEVQGARAAAMASDLLRPWQGPRSVLDGLPVSVKDLFDIAGQPTPAGSRVLADAAPAVRSATVVRRLQAAGAVIVGRTNMTEFAYSGLGLNPHHGTPLNPWDRATGRIPGGSSSGAAVSVSDGMAVAAIGSDTGGSVRIPAALCGLAGFKPTARRVSLEGVLPLSTHLDSIGPIARSVACCAEVDALLAGDGDAVTAPARLRGLRLLVPQTVALDDLEAEVAAAFASSLSRLSAAGVRIDEQPLPVLSRLASINARGGFTAAEAWAWHRDLIARAGDRYDPRVVSRIRRGDAMSAADLIDVIQARRAWVDEVNQALAGHDAMLMPTVPLVAPALQPLQDSDDGYGRANLLMLRNPTLINFLDGCALSLPCHRPGDAPVGLMVAGVGGADRRILAIGLAIEQALRH